jgi:hypothetical protein
MAIQEAGGTSALPQTPARTGVPNAGRVVVTAATALALVATAGCVAGGNPSSAGQRTSGSGEEPDPTEPAPSTTAAPQEGTVQVPDPGLVPLGTIDSGLDVVAAAGDDFDMTISVLD